MMSREYHFVAFHASWERLVGGTFPGSICKPGLMYHSIAMMDLKKHPVLTNFCRVSLFDVARDATKAHPFICKLLVTLPEVIASTFCLIAFSLPSLLEFCRPLGLRRSDGSSSTLCLARMPFC